MASKFTYQALKKVEPESIKFELFTNEEVKKLSVVKITNSTSFDIMGNPTQGGLYDPAMGPLRERNDFCVTCSSPLLHCPGHYGHIDLPLVVVHPLVVKSIYTLFRVSCLKCFKIQISEKNKFLLKLILQLIDAGHITSALDLESMLYSDTKSENSWSPENPGKVIKKYQKLLKKKDNVTEIFQSKNKDKIRNKIVNTLFRLINMSKTCAFCRNKLIKVTTSDGKIMHRISSSDKESGNKILMPDEIQQYCAKIAENDEDVLIHCMPILKTTDKKPVTDLFFMDTVLVVPPNVRPCNVLRGELVEHPQSNVYKSILFFSFHARVVLQVLSAADSKTAINKLDQAPRQAYEAAFGKSPAEKLHTIWLELQKRVNHLLSCDVQGYTSQGLKQILEKKTGLLRMNMMGKRVNYAARTVITPDPNVDVDEIGIPEAIAEKLTYPVPVTEWNVDELRQMVINGPNKYPGAEKIEMGNGRIVWISPDSVAKRIGLARRLLTPEEYKSAGVKIVHRHLINGDIMILNRQPSLHKPSMMAHRVRVLKGEKTFRLHYANCKSYNADFDGDEMNAHLPQNEIARSEAYNIMSVRKQYLVPKDGTPLSGLIQDHVISGVRMSLRGKFFNKEDYHQIVYQGLSNHKGMIKLLPPAILKPQVLWSGKQILSTIIINTIPKDKPRLTLIGSSKISAKAWQTKPPKQWKAGGTLFTDPKCMTEAEVIIRKGELLCGVLDKNHYGATPYSLVHCMNELYGGDVSCDLLSSFSKIFSYYLQQTGFSLSVKDVLVTQDADNIRNDLMCLAGQIGKPAAAQASGLPVDIDDEELKNQISEMMNNDPKFRAKLDRQYKSLLDSYTNKINTACLSEGLLEKFPTNNLQLMVQSGAKGSTVNTMQISCLLGQIELEGKRPSIMLSGRCLPCFLPYDFKPRAGGFIDGRFLTGIKAPEFFFHCMAGREGLIDTAVKTSRSGYLQRCLIKHLEGLSVGYDNTVRDSDGSVIQFAYGEDGLDVVKCQFLKENQFKFIATNSRAMVSKSDIKKLKEDANLKSIAKSQKALKKWLKKYGSSENIRTSGFALFSSIVKEELKNIEKPTDETRDPLYWEIEKRWRSMDPEDRKQYERKLRPDPIQSKMLPSVEFGAINEKLESVIQNFLDGNPQLTDKQKEEFVDVMRAKYLSSMVAPGEPVGLLAAQSIGEPSTQMTLNTFHFAGRGDMNVTLGIPRLREILMTASAKLKTPSMEIPFKSNTPNLTRESEKLRKKLNRTTVAEVLEKIDVTVETVVEPERYLKTTLRFVFLPHEQYKAQFAVRPKRIIKHMQEKFFNLMFATIRRYAKVYCGVFTSVDKERVANVKGDDDDNEDGNAPVAKGPAVEDSDNSDEEGPNEDDDTTATKKRSRKAEGQEYEDPESEEEDNEEVELEKEMLKDTDEVLEMTKDDIEEDHLKIMQDVVGSLTFASDYTYDTENYEWCELTVQFPISYLKIDLTQSLREAANKSYINEVKNIKRAFVTKEKDVTYLKTEGINIVEMFKYVDLLDMNKLYSNDIHAIANTYGIEAANKVLIKEIQNVFNVYGIVVDPRHLSLIADYMTYNGVYEPLSRKGMEASTSPLQQMSFESSLIFLKDAVLNQKVDKIRSPSSCLMMGQPSRMGTGSFGLLYEYKGDM